jgi:hypothetical protein
MFADSSGTDKPGQNSRKVSGVLFPESTVPVALKLSKIQNDAKNKVVYFEEKFTATKIRIPPKLSRVSFPMEIFFSWGNTDKRRTAPMYIFYVSERRLYKLRSQAQCPGFECR